MIKVRLQNGPITNNQGKIYPSAIDAIVNPAKLLDSGIDHSLYTLRISNIHVDNEIAVFGVRRQTLALLSRVASAILIQVCNNDTRGSGFREGQGSFTSDATSRLDVK